MAINVLTMDAMPQFTSDIALWEVPHFEGIKKAVRIGGSLTLEEEAQLLSLLREWSDIFAWDINDLTGISLMIIRHSLNIDPGFKPIHQAWHHKREEQWLTGAEEVEKLLTSGCIEKVICSKWVSNIVMVRKANVK